VVTIRPQVPSLTTVIQVLGPPYSEKEWVSFETQLEQYPADRLLSGRTIASDDLAAYFHTGGTTGSPKHENASVLVPWPQIPMMAWANGLSHRLAQQMVWQPYRTANTIMREALQMSPTAFWGPFVSLQKQRRHILYGYSPQVLPRLKDWDDFIHITGYWFLEPPTPRNAQRGERTRSDFREAGGVDITHHICYY